MSPLPGWQVTLCDPMWHMSSRSGVATLRTAIHLLLTYLLTSHGPVSVRPSVTSRCSVEAAERIELVLACVLPSTRPTLC